MKEFIYTNNCQKCAIVVTFKKQLHMECKHCATYLVARLKPEFSCYLRGRLYPGPTHAMLAECSLKQIKGLRKLILTILYLILLSSPTMAYPRNKRGEPETTVIEHNDKIIVQTTGCRSWTNQDKRDFMGSAFDESKMAYDDDSVKRSSLFQTVIKDGTVKDKKNDVGYLFDDSEIDDISNTKDKGSTVSVQNRKFMRRKRDVTESNRDTRASSFLYQNLAFDTITKRKSREKRSASSSHLSNFHPAWECKKRKIWRKMQEGYFPTRILDGKCGKRISTPDTCFFGMYTCNPVKYSIKVLKRDPVDACRPVPIIGANTTYEETWVFVRQTVTVACECGTPSSRSSEDKRSSKRQKNRDRSKGRDE